jgi:hypothetical protein
VRARFPPRRDLCSARPQSRGDGPHPVHVPTDRLLTLGSKQHSAVLGPNIRAVAHASVSTRLPRLVPLPATLPHMFTERGAARRQPPQRQDWRTRKTAASRSRFLGQADRQAEGLRQRPHVGRRVRAACRARPSAGVFPPSMRVCRIDRRRVRRGTAQALKAQKARDPEPQRPRTRSLGSERMLHPPKAAEDELADALARQLELRGDPVERSLRPF